MKITKTATIKTVTRVFPRLTISASRDANFYGDRAEAEVKLEEFLAEAVAVLGQAWANHTGDAVRVQVGSCAPYTIGVETKENER